MFSVEEIATNIRLSKAEREKAQGMLNGFLIKRQAPTETDLQNILEDLNSHYTSVGGIRAVLGLGGRKNSDIDEEVKLLEAQIDDLKKRIEALKVPKRSAPVLNLNPEQMALEFVAEQLKKGKDIYTLAMDDVLVALACLKNPNYIKKLTILDFSTLLINYDKDENISQICELIAGEIALQIKNKKIDVKELEVHLIDTLRKHTHILDVAINEQAQLQFAAFIFIYKSLRDGDSKFDIFKTKLESKSYCEQGKSAKDSIREIEIYATDEKHKDSRTAVAWKLAQAHYPNCHKKNVELISSIYNESFKGGIFKVSKVTGSWFFKHRENITLTEAQIIAGAKKVGSRTAKIVAALPDAPVLNK